MTREKFVFACLQPMMGVETTTRDIFLCWTIMDNMNGASLVGPDPRLEGSPLDPGLEVR